MIRRAAFRSNRATFTLVEMMVALVAGAMAITSIYYVSASSSRHFQEQQRVAQTQMSLRMAMEQVRRDLSRAGYFGTPDSQREQNCVPPASRIQAIDMVNDAYTGALTNAATNGVEADRVLLTGNYATGDSYLAIGMNANGNEIFFQKSWQGFRRSFGDPPDDALFQQVFAVGRWVHMTTQEGNHFFAEILSSDASVDPPRVQIDTNWPVGSPCLQIGSGATVAPLMRIEYAVVDPVGGPIQALATASPIVSLNGPTLIRREVEVAGGRVIVPIADTERVVAEYVAEFDVDFVVNTAAVGAVAVFAQRDNAVADGALAGTPYNARAATVRLSVRTALEDDRFLFVARGAGAPLTRYEVDPAADGAARVRTERTEIFLPNVALRDLR